MKLANVLAALGRTDASNDRIARRDLTFIRLPMPALGRAKLLDAVRLQLTQYLPPRPYAYLCRVQAGGNVQVWAWTLEPGLQGPLRSRAWPEPALEPPGQGLRLLRRTPGYEAQFWADGELQHSRWFEREPEDSDWQLFARGCGVDPQSHALPQPATLACSPRPGPGWLAGDSLPAGDPWRGWRWQAAALALGAVACAGIGAQWQAVQQLETDSTRLETLRREREASLQARARYERVHAELDALQALVPRLSQLELLDRVAASGIFAPTAKAGGTPALPGSAPGGAGATAATLTAARLLEWNYRSGQLKLTLELPDREMTLLDITRRLEAVPGLSALRVGQDSAGNSLSLSATIAELAPPPTGSGNARELAGIR
ncbi:MAG: hypothetical protein KGN16_03225 [Burkholderiales bacterium]|nr:hypothetical protein [Burkholderiales bacterium]